MPTAAENEATIERFYDAFSRRDGEAMESCYADDIYFRDPAFGELRGPRAGAMWRMLTGQAKDLEVQLASNDAGERTGKANWIADYTFSATGNKVHNDINASFEFDQEGQISKHVDEFSFYTWSRQALGLPGLLLGWTPIIHNKVSSQANANLDKFMAEEGSS